MFSFMVLIKKYKFMWDNCYRFENTRFYVGLNWY